MLVLTARDGDRVDIEINGKKLTLEFFVERRRVRVGYQGPMGFRVTRQSKTSALGARVRALRAPKALSVAKEGKEAAKLSELYYLGARVRALRAPKALSVAKEGKEAANVDTD